MQSLSYYCAIQARELWKQWRFGVLISCLFLVLFLPWIADHSSATEQQISVGAFGYQLTCIAFSGEVGCELSDYPPKSNFSKHFIYKVISNENVGETDDVNVCDCEATTEFREISDFAGFRVSVGNALGGNRKRLFAIALPILSLWVSTLIAASVLGFKMFLRASKRGRGLVS